MHFFAQQIKKIFLISAACTGMFTPLSGQELWSLEDCILYAFENNIQIKQQMLNSDMYRNNLFQSKAELFPNLNAGGNVGQSFGRALDATTYEFYDQQIKSSSFSISSSVILFNGLQQYNTIKQNKFNLLSSIEDIEKIKNDISLMIAAAYLQILMDMELMAVAENQLGITSLQVERTRKLVDAGSLPRGSLLEIQSQAASEELLVINTQNSLDISYLTLIQLLDLDSAGGFAVEVPELEAIVDQPLILTIGSVFDEARNLLPQVKSAEFQLESAKKNLNIARGARSPRITLSGTYGSSYSDIRKLYDPENPLVGKDYPFSDQMKDNANTIISLGMNVPIFNGWMVNTYISNARLGVMNYRLQLENTENLLFKDIQKAYTDAVAARKKYFATEQALIAMEESFRYTEQKFEVGLVNTVDYNAEKNRLTQTQSELLQAKYDFIFKTKILDFYRGIPLSLK
jgi:outer membrane protein